MIAAPVSASIGTVDADGDNLATYEEMIAVYPDLSEETFGQIDTNEDGVLDDAEMTAAVDAELLEPVPAE